MLNSTIQDSLMTKSAGFARLGRAAFNGVNKLIGHSDKLLGGTALAAGGAGFGLGAPSLYRDLMDLYRWLNGTKDNSKATLKAPTEGAKV